MPNLSLKVNIPSTGAVKTMQFDANMMVYDACKLIRDRLPDPSSSSAKDFGMFLPDEDPKKGVWLEPGRTLEYYLLKTGDLVEYRKKIRPLRVKMMDGALKTVMVDDSQIVEDLVKTICERIGVSNYEEYSLIHEEDDGDEDKKKPSDKEKELKVRDAKKMEQIRKQWHTDDELHWLNQDKSLREQGIDETSVLTLRKKYFFSDQNVDRNDPVQLNLLYVQARDGILQGSHPVSQDEAYQFAALQAQVQYSNYDSSKTKAYVDVKEFLPKEYQKKGVEKRILTEYAKLTGLTELNAKFRYIQLSRSLKTYGVSFFLVKEKMKGKNKLVPRLLGVTKESVMRVDEKTKEVMKTWPLTTVRRWAASPNSFTLDFGDYSESYYSVQTTEGETISQLIAGYIDIILSRQKQPERPLMEMDNEATMHEDEVAPGRAYSMQYQQGDAGRGSEGNVAMPGVMRNAQMPLNSMQLGVFPSNEGEGRVRETMTRGNMPPDGQMGSNTSTSAAQQALTGNINNTLGVIRNIIPDLQNPMDLPPIGNDPGSVGWKQNQIDLQRQNVSSQVTAITAAAAQVVTLTSGDPAETNYTAVGSAVTTISSNMSELAKGLPMLAGLLSDTNDSNKILEAARNLADAAQGLLQSALPENQANRQALLAALGETGAAGGNLLALIGEEQVDKQYQDDLMALAQNVAAATRQLVQRSKQVATECDDKQLQSNVIEATKQSAMSTSQLVACTKALASVVHSPLAQDQLIAAAKQVADAVEKVVGNCSQATDNDKLLEPVGTAGTDVTQAVNALLNKVREGPAVAVRGRHDEACDAVLAAIDRLHNAQGNPAEMAKQARSLATASSQMVQSLRDEASGLTDKAAIDRLLQGAKALADATARMVAAAKTAASNPADEDAQAGLKKATDDLRNAMNAAAGDGLRKRVIKRLEFAAKQASASSTQLIAAAQGASASNRNPSSQQQLAAHGKHVADAVGTLVQAIRQSTTHPDSASAQLQLINASQQLIQPASKLIAASKAAVPTVGDQAAALQLGNFAKTTARALADLRSAANKALEACGSLELDSAADTIRELIKDVDTCMRVAKEEELMSLPGETLETAALELGATSKTVGSSMAQLLTAASQGNENYTGIAARDVANALKVLNNASRGVAAGFNKQPEAQEAVLKSARTVMENSLSLVLQAKQSLADPTSPENRNNLARAAKAVSQALGAMIGCLPGLRDVDAAIKSIASGSQKLLAGQYPHLAESYQQLQLALSEAGAGLNASAANLVVSSRGSNDMLAAAAKKFADDFLKMLNAAMAVAGAASDKGDQSQVVGYTRNVSVAASKLLLAGKALAADPNAPNVKNNLASAARNVTESINSLLGLCSSNTPGQRECDNALRTIQASANMLDNINEPVNAKTFFACQETVRDTATKCGELMSKNIGSQLKANNMNGFGDDMSSAAQCVCQMIETATQASYLVGISDPSSIAGTAGVVDSTTIAQAHQAIKDGCETLVSPNATQQQLLSAATHVAKHTSTLCTACKQASAKTSNAVAKKHFVAAAKDVATRTAQLVQAIKALSSNPTEENRAACSNSTGPLMEAVDGLVTYSSSPEFASVPAQISPPAQGEMRPITDAARNMVASSCSYITAARNLCANPDDKPNWQLLNQHGKAVADAMRKLLEEIVAKAPGQRECDDTIDKMNQFVNAIDQATLGAISNTLRPHTDSTLEGFHKQALQALGEVSDHIDPLSVAAKTESEKLGHQVASICNQFGPLMNGVVGAASRTKDHNKQVALLNQAKTLAESMLEMLYAAKRSGGNPEAVAAHDMVDETAQGTRDAIKDLSDTLETAASASGAVSTLVDSIQKASMKVDEPLMAAPEKSYVDYQGNMVQTARRIAMKSQDVLGKAGQDPSAIMPLAQDVVQQYSNLASDARHAVAATDQQDVGFRIKESVQNLGKSTTDLVLGAAAVAGSPSDPQFRRELSDAARAVSEKVSYVLAALQAGSRGTQACIDAMDELQGLIGDLDTTSMFAAAGTLTSESGSGTAFAEHRDAILDEVKRMVKDTEELVGSAAGSQLKLEQAAKNAMGTTKRLVGAAKLGASALGPEDKEAQVLILNAVKDVAGALSGLLGATKNASGKPSSAPEMEKLRVAAKQMVGNVTSLLKTMKSAEDEAARGARAIESALDAISLEMAALTSADAPKIHASPEELIMATKGITSATGKAVAAGNSGKQNEAVAAANMGRKAVVGLLQAVKSTAMQAETPQIRDGALMAGRQCGQAYSAVLSHMLEMTQKKDPSMKRSLPELSKAVAIAVGNVVQSAQSLKGSDWVNPDDPNVIAENELLAAAAAIEAASKQLQQLKPRQSKHEADESLSFDEQILAAARAITAATGALVKSATQAQRELVAQGRISSGSGGARYLQDDDGQWSQGLVSAAKMVAETTGQLCEAANAVVQGGASQEKLVAAAMGVSKSTAQLLLACMVKADPNSDSSRRLQEAGNHVKHAAEGLVKAAQQAADDEAANVDIHRSTKATGRIAQELEAQEAILRKERELEDARNQLMRLRKLKYGGSGGAS
eukprot:scpid5059/ scgid6971/ Talin-1